MKNVDSTGNDAERRALDPYDVMAQRLIDHIKERDPGFVAIIDEEIARQRAGDSTAPDADPLRSDARDTDSSKLNLQRN
jgi:hypothetical protein